MANDAILSSGTQTSERQAFIGRSPFVFASRFFQRFVQKDWTNTKIPKRVGERNLNHAPIISETPFDLRFFAPEPVETSEVAPCPVDASQLLAKTNFNDVASTNALWRRLVLALNRRLCVVAPLTCENHADRCVSSDLESDATAIVEASGVRVYCPKAPPKPESEGLRQETPTEQANDAIDEFPCYFRSPRAREKTARCDILGNFWEGTRTIFQNLCGCVAGFVFPRSSEEKAERRAQQRSGVEFKTFEQKRNGNLGKTAVCPATKRWERRKRLTKRTRAKKRVDFPCFPK